MTGTKKKVSGKMIKSPTLALDVIQVLDSRNYFQSC